MKAVLNVDGKKLEVTSINLNKGEITSVQVDYGNYDYQTYHDRKNIIFREDALLVNMEEALEFPELEERIVEGNNKLIKHLEELIIREKENLTTIAIDAMEGEANGLPFSELPLSDAQKEYKLAEQYMLGIVDAVEGVKAYTEGFYADKNNDESVETEKHHQSIE